MPTKHTLTGSFADLLGAGVSGSRLEVTLATNAGAHGVVDLDTNKVDLPGPVRVSLTGASFSLELIATNSSGINVLDGTLRYIVHAAYRDSSNRERTWSSGYFELTSDADLSDLVGTEYLPPTFASAAIAQMEDLLAQAEEAVGLTGEDAAVATLLTNPTSDTFAASDAATATQIGDPGSEVAKALGALVIDGGAP